MKRLVRKFALWLEWRTSVWILPTQVWLDIEYQKPSAVKAVDLAEKFWGTTEPELLKARARISQVAYFANNPPSVKPENGSKTVKGKHEQENEGMVDLAVKMRKY